MPDGPMLQRLSDLKKTLADQGRLVQRVLEDAVEAVFSKDAAKAATVIERDVEIDAVDVRVERDAVRLLTEAASKAQTELGEYEIRLILTIVKVNNEFERIGDLAGKIATQVPRVGSIPQALPAKFRVLANSIIGIMHNTNAAFAHLDIDSARLVLSSDDATELFQRAILRDTEEGLAAGRHSVDFAFALQTIAGALARIGDHCTNVAEQVIYVETGKIVRHLDDHWTAPEDPNV